MTPEKIKKLIDTKIAGQGNEVDMASVLPVILSELLGQAFPSAETSIPAGGMAPNTYYKLGELEEAIAFSIAAGGEDKLNLYYWVFDTGESVPEVTWPTVVAWDGDAISEETGLPLLTANKHYEVSILEGYGIVKEF